MKESVLSFSLLPSAAALHPQLGGTVGGWDLAESYRRACFNDAATVSVSLCWDARCRKSEREAEIKCFG